jgi:hypothetical protein
MIGNTPLGCQDEGKTLGRPVHDSRLTWTCSCDTSPEAGGPPTGRVAPAADRSHASGRGVTERSTYFGRTCFQRVLGVAFREIPRNEMRFD